MAKQPIILYIDDDIDDVEILTSAISTIDENFQIINAVNGEEGLKKLNELIAAQQIPCLIVLDINMPKMNGKETVLALNNDPSVKNIPIVILSTSRSNMDQLFFSKQNVIMLSKPMSFTDYIATAKELINQCRL